MNRRPWKEIGLLWLVVFILYRVTLPHNHCQTDDSIGLVNDIESGQPDLLFHPHHLVYNFVVRVLFDLAGVRRVTLLAQTVDITFGSLGVAAFYLLLRERLADALVALMAALFLAFSYTYWLYSVEVEVYAPATTFLILTLLLVFWPPGEAGPGRLALAGLSHGLAILFHQTGVLLIPAVILALLLQRNDTEGAPGKSRPYSALLVYLMVMALMVSVPYLLVAISLEGVRSSYEFYLWATTGMQLGLGGSLSLPGPLWLSLLRQSVLRLPIGLLRTVMGGHFLLVLPPTRAWIFFACPYLTAVEEQFLVRNMSVGLAGFLLPLSGLVVAGLIFSLILYVPFLKNSGPKHRAFFLVMLAWFVPFALFAAWWGALNNEILRAILPAFTALICLPFVGRAGLAFRAALALIVGCLFLTNLLGSIWLQRSLDDDYWFHKVSWYIDHTEEHDLVIVRGRNYRADYVIYYSQADVLVLGDFFIERSWNDEQALADLDTTIRRYLDSGQRVFVSSDVLSFEAPTATYSRWQLSSFEQFRLRYQNLWACQPIPVDDTVCVFGSFSSRL